MNLPFFIARRYLFARKSHNVINIISAISAVGMAIGTAALIIVLSVYNGFDSLVRQSLSETAPDLKVVPVIGKSFVPDSSIFAWVYDRDEVFNMSSVIEENVFISYDQQQCVAKAKGVVTITGTAAYEAALLGKRSIVFGDVPFSIIDGVTRIRSYEDLPEAIRSFGAIDNIHSAAAYLEAVKEAGAEVKIFELMDGAEDIFAGKTKETPEFDEMLQELLYFYEKGYQRWLNGEIRDDVPKDGGKNE